MFTATKNNFADAQKFIANELSCLTLSEKEIFFAQLMFEENFLRLHHGIATDDENFTVKIKIRRWFGDVSLILSVKGKEFNPIANIESELNFDDEDYYNLAILKANRQKIGYARKNDENVVSIPVHEMHLNRTQKTLAAILLGLCFGLILKSFCPAEINSWLQTNIFHPVHDMFMNALSMMVSPMIFFAMADMILHLWLEIVFSLGKIIFGAAIGAALTLIVSEILIGVFAKVSPVIFCKKIIPFSILPFTLISSNACLPSTLKFCVEKLGIDSKLSMFSIPIGIQFNMNGHSFYLAFMAVLNFRRNKPCCNAGYFSRAVYVQATARNTKKPPSC